jgi:hypothetical protein
MQVEISQQVEAINPKLKFVDAYQPHTPRWAVAFGGEPSSEMLHRVAENIAEQYPSGKLAWEPVQKDGETTILAFRFEAE